MSDLVKFLAAGVPSFLIAVPLNYILVTEAGVPAPLAYALVLVAQVSCNFLLLRRFVFDSSSNPTPVAHQFARFLSGIGMFRALDWATFTVTVTVIGIYFLAAQLINIVFFSLLKFRFSKEVIEGRSG